MARWGHALVALMVAVLFAGAASADLVDPGEGPFLLTADEIRYDYERGRAIAEGDVEISRDARTLLADRVVYDEVADRVEAMGNVVLIEPTGEALFAERFELTGDLREGAIEQLRVRLADDSRFAAARGERREGRLTVMDRAVYSPCELCQEDETRPPLWQITAREVRHDQEARQVTYRHAFFELFGVPVAYTPYFTHPDPTVERKTGFLSPTFGSDSQLGFSVETPYHIVLAPNRDVTLSPTFTTKEGPVLAAEYRELRERGPLSVDGSLTYASRFQADPEDRGGRTLRGHIDGEARYDLEDDLGPGWFAGGDLALSSDRTFRQRYGFRSESILTNRLFAERIVGRDYGLFAGYAFQGLRPGDVRGEIPIVLPLAEMELFGERDRFGGRWIADTSLVALTRTAGLDTRRVSLEGGYELPFRDQLGGLYTFSLNLRGDVYNISGDPVTRDAQGPTTTVGRLQPRATLDWRWPWMREDRRWQHVIEPVASFTVSPFGGNDPRIPNEDSIDLEFDDTNLFEPIRFPGRDRVEGGPRITYGLRLRSEGAGGRRIAGLLGQSFRPRKDDTFGRGTGLEGRFSDYVGRVEFTPHPWVDVDYRFRLRRDAQRLMRNDVRASLGPRRARLDVNYLLLADEPDEDEFREREELTATLSLRLHEDLTLGLRTRRDLTLNTTIANSLGLVYKGCECMLVVAGIERSFTRTRDLRPTTTISLRVTLRNLGEFGADADILNGT